MANQFAAMPSLHVGWAVLSAVVCLRTGPRLVGFSAALHAVLTVGVVIVTAIHWWLDGVVSCLLLAVALAVFPGPGQPARLPGRRSRTLRRGTA